MTIEELHWALEFEYNKLSNNHFPAITDVEKDRVLRISTKDYFNMFAHGKNPKSLEIRGFEYDRQRIDMLTTLVKSYPDEPALTIVDLGANQYKVDLITTKYKFGSFVSAKVNVKDCAFKYTVEPKQHADLATNDYHQKSSRAFQKISSLERNKTLYFEAVDFVPLTLELTYLKEPAEVALGTYNSLYGTLVPKVESDLPDFYHDLLILIAVQNLQRIYPIAHNVLSENKINNLT